MFGKKKIAENEISIKDVASKLDISEATVKKYLRDFKLDNGKNKSSIEESSFTMLSEITKLRNNGMSIQEIKDLMAQKPPEEIVPEVQETPIVVDEKKDVEVKAPEYTFDIEDFKNLEKDEEKKPEIELKEDEATSTQEGSEEVEESEDAEGSEESEEEISSDSEVDIGDGTNRRRRLFNYRYIERQISSDAKRIQALRHRLKNPNLPVQDRLFFEESLERRILFLDGWKHLLRWVSLGNKTKRTQEAEAEEKEAESSNI